MVEKIRCVHAQSRQTYGSPRIHAELRAQGQRCNHKRIERLMRQHAIRARRVRRFQRTTEVSPSLPVAPNQLHQEFSASAPNRVWTADITYLDTAEGWLYEEPFGSQEIVKERHHEISAHFWWHQQQQHPQRAG